MKYALDTGKVRMVDSDGNPISNGAVKVFKFGTDELADVFADRQGKTQLEQPIALDANGVMAGFFDVAVTIDVFGSNGAMIKTVPFVGLMGDAAPLPRAYGPDDMVVDEADDVLPTMRRIVSRRAYEMPTDSAVVVERCWLSSEYDNNITLHGVCNAGATGNKSFGVGILFCYGDSTVEESHIGLALHDVDVSYSDGNIVSLGGPSLVVPASELAEFGGRGAFADIKIRAADGGNDAGPFNLMMIEVSHDY